VIQTKVAICAGFSDLVTELMRVVGIPAQTIVGQAAVYSPGAPNDTALATHAWDKIYVNNNWFSMDKTFDTSYVHTAVPGVNGEYRFHRNTKPYNPSQSLFAQTHQETLAAHP